MKNARKQRAFFQAYRPQAAGVFSSLMNCVVLQLLTTSSLRSAIVLLISTGLPFKRFSA